jgi:hypothetical protein
MRFTRVLVLIPAASLAGGLNAELAIATETGIPECDKYFTMVEACMATRKMSTDDQRAAQVTVDQLRTMLPLARAPQGRAELVKRCTASLEAAHKDDKYGCYSAK